MNNISKNKKISKLSPPALTYISLGANCASPLGAPLLTLRAALKRLHSTGAHLRQRSRFYTTQPIGEGLRRHFINGAAVCHVRCRPDILLARFKNLERLFGRRASPGPRPFDLDILDDRRLCWDQTSHFQIQNCVLPHPRMHTRRFVLAPLAEIAPDWIHPRSSAPIRLLRARSSGRVAVFSFFPLRRRARSRKNSGISSKKGDILKRRCNGARHS